MKAFIPVKAESSRLPRKNFLDFGNGSLLTHKISQLNQVSAIDEIIVSSDSEELLKVANELGCKSILRPDHISKPDVKFSDFVAYVCSITGITDLLWACVTSPLVKVKTYENAIKVYQERNSDYESLVSVYEFRHHMFNKYGEPANFKIGPEHPDSQFLEPAYLFTNGIVIANTRKMLAWGDHFGPRSILFPVSQIESVDIDTEVDYKLAIQFQHLVVE